MSTATKGRPHCKPCPPEGGGVNSWTLSAANACKRAGLSEDEAEAWITENMTCAPRRNEVERSVQKAFNPKAWRPAALKWPLPDRAKIEAIASSGFGVADLWEISPVRWGDDAPPGELLRLLFPGDPWICAGRTNERFFTRRLSKFADTSHLLQLVVPNPMLRPWGKTTDGKDSQHTLEATGPRRFLVIEGDLLDEQPIPKDTQAAILLHLARKAPLSLVVDSGGKSLHGWFNFSGVTDDDPRIKGFFSYACTLGADPRMWKRDQFCRMPDGTRDTGARQPVLFFNPETL
jgi:hypothetical protein